MTGPGPGKIPLNAKVFAVKEGKRYELPATVYVHMRGYSRARVTHIDIELPGIEEKIPREGFYGCALYSDGFRIMFGPLDLYVRSEDLKGLFPPEETVVYVGKKVGGIYVGFKKKIVERLERRFMRRLQAPPAP